jgi:hypothetical protein
MERLHAALAGSHCKVSPLVADWHSKLQVDGPGSVASVLSLVVDAARPLTSQAALVTSDMIVGNNPTDSVKEICSALAEKPAADKRTFARIRKSFRQFWVGLVHDSPNSVLFDTDLLETLISWLAAMSTASSRPLRLAACDAAYAIVDGLIEVGRRLRSNLATFERQLSTERKKSSAAQPTRQSSRPKRTKSFETRSSSSTCTESLSSKGKDLANKVANLCAYNKELGELTDKIFSTICVVKYRDVAPEIRTASVQALGNWVVRYPEHFLDDGHNKYIGWLLYDKEASVRRTALAVLGMIFSEPKFAPSLEIFAHRFVKRIVEMSNDRDSEVCVLAVRLCVALVPLEVLDQSSIDSLCSLYASENGDLQRAAGELIAALIKLGADEDGLADSIGPNPQGTKQSDALVMPTSKAKGDLRELIFTVLGESTGDPTAAILVLDAVWNHMPAVRCWEAYGELFSEFTNGDMESISAEERLGGDDMASLAGLLLGAAKRLHDHGSKLGTKSNHVGAKQRGKGAKTVVDSGRVDREELTGYLGPVLPKLLMQFRTDERVASLLAQLPRHMCLPMFTMRSMESHFNALLSELGDMICRHTASPHVAQVAAATLKNLAATDDPLSNSAVVSLGKEGSNASKALRSAVRAGLTKANETAIASALVRSAILSELTELPDSTSHDALAILRATSSAADSEPWNPCVRINACRLLAGCWMWATHRVFSDLKLAPPSKTNWDDTAMKTYFHQRDTFVSHLLPIIQRPSEDTIVRSAALKVISLILTLTWGLQKNLGANLPFKIQIVPEIDLFKESVGRAMQSCLISMIAKQLQDDESLVSDCRELISCIGQVLFLRVLPDQFAHLPLLGYALSQKKLQPRNEEVGVVASDLAKLYHNRIESTRKHDDLVVLEARALLDAIAIDKQIGHESDCPSLHAVSNAMKKTANLLDIENTINTLKQAMGRKTLFSESEWHSCLARYAKITENRKAGGKKRVPPSQEETLVRKRKRAREPVDMHNVRRSGRTHRVSNAYAETEWDAEPESDSCEDDEGILGTKNFDTAVGTLVDVQEKRSRRSSLRSPSSKSLSTADSEDKENKLNSSEHSGPKVLRSKRGRRW